MNRWLNRPGTPLKSNMHSFAFSPSVMRHSLTHPASKRLFSPAHLQITSDLHLKVGWSSCVWLLILLSLNKHWKFYVSQNCEDLQPVVGSEQHSNKKTQIVFEHIHTAAIFLWRQTQDHDAVFLLIWLVITSHLPDWSAAENIMKIKCGIGGKWPPCEYDFGFLGPAQVVDCELQWIKRQNV